MRKFYIDDSDRNPQRFIWEFPKRIARVLGTSRTYEAYCGIDSLTDSGEILRVPLLYLTLTNTTVSDD